jgi:hypothetical protein
VGSAAGLKRGVSSGRQRGSGQGDRGDPGDDSDETGHLQVLSLDDGRRQCAIESPPGCVRVVIEM